MKGVMRVVCVIIMVYASGCSKPVQNADDDEMDHPMMVKASELAQAGNMDGAVRIYGVLLEKHPDMARAHLGIAMLLDRPHGDCLRAVYHYQRYLELRPDTEKRKMIISRIHDATVSLVGTVFTNEPAVVKRVVALDRENAALKVKIANLETRLARSQMMINSLQARQGRWVNPAEDDSGARRKPVDITKPMVRTVTVQKNDTLRRLADRAYGDQNRWRDIYEANRNLLRMPEDIRVGQVLIVPE